MRELTNRWVGPFAYRAAFYVIPSGLYMVFIGQDPIFLAASDKIARRLTEHAIYGGGRVRPGDMVGRDLLAYSRQYGQPLSVKLATVLDGKKVVTDMETLENVASLLVWSRRFPCNPYGRDAYEGTEPLTVHNVGKRFPLEETYTSEPDEPTD